LALTLTARPNSPNLTKIFRAILLRLETGIVHVVSLKDSPRVDALEL